MQPAIQAIWQRGIPQTRERLLLLQSAAEQLSNSRSLDAELRAEAIAVAHKLAGSLGMFGFAEATEHARSIEQQLEHDGLPQPERLQASVDALSETLREALA